MEHTIEGLTINESYYTLEDNKKGKLAVFMYYGTLDPKAILEEAICEYVGKNDHYELIDSNLNNPWMRVIISNINDMNQEVFDLSKHKL